MYIFLSAPPSHSKPQSKLAIAISSRDRINKLVRSSSDSSSSSSSLMKKYTCKICRVPIGEVKQLEDHYLSRHGVLTCPACPGFKEQKKRKKAAKKSSNNGVGDTAASGIAKLCFFHKYEGGGKLYIYYNR